MPLIFIEIKLGLVINRSFSSKNFFVVSLNFFVTSCVLALSIAPNTQREPTADIAKTMSASDIEKYSKLVKNANYSETFVRCVRITDFSFKFTNNFTEWVSPALEKNFKIFMVKTFGQEYIDDATKDYQIKNFGSSDYYREQPYKKEAVQKFLDAKFGKQNNEKTENKSIEE